MYPDACHDVNSTSIKIVLEVHLAQSLPFVSCTHTRYPEVRLSGAEPAAAQRCFALLACHTRPLFEIWSRMAALTSSEALGDSHC